MSEYDRTDEIDLKSLLKAVLATRSWVIVAVVIASVLYWLAQVAFSLIEPPLNHYRLNVFLTFTGAERNTYPNGSPWGVRDLIAPAILNDVYDRAGVGTYIERGDFVESFTASPYTPQREMIIEKYQAALSRSNLTQADIEKLQSDMDEELRQAAAQAVSIFFVTPESIPPGTMEHAMRLIPQVWSDHMVKRVGVASFNIEMFSDNVIDETLILGMDYLVAFESLVDKTRLLKENIRRIKELPNGLIARDPESGLSPPDLEKAVEDVEQYLIEPLVRPIRTLGIARDPEVVLLFFEQRLERLERERTFAEKRKRNLLEAFNHYAKETGAGRSDTRDSGTMIPQIDAGFLDRIVELTSAGVDVTFRQDITREQVLLADELSRIESETERLKIIIEALNNARGDAGQRQKYSDRAEKMLPEIMHRVAGHFRTSMRLHEELSANLDQSGYMFRYAGGIQRDRSNQVVTLDKVRNYIIVLFVVVVLIVPFKMMRNAVSGESSQAD